MKSDDMLAVFAFALVFAAGILTGDVAARGMFQGDSIGLLTVVVVANGASLVAILAYLAAVHASSGKERGRLVFVRKNNGTATVEER